jgi:CheY-like chemotaxis protein
MNSEYSLDPTEDDVTRRARPGTGIHEGRAISRISRRALTAVVKLSSFAAAQTLKTSITRDIRVLIIDAFDERDMYAEAFRSYGFTVTTASTATEGLKILDAQGIDVIVQGLVFPDLVGVELARRLKARGDTRRKPLIVLSGFTDQQTLDAVRATGSDSVLIKPCSPTTLAAEIQRVLRHPQHEPVQGRSRKRTVPPL